MGGLGALTAVSYHAPSGVAFRRRRDMLQFYVRTLRLASVVDHGADKKLLRDRAGRPIKKRLAASS